MAGYAQYTNNPASCDSQYCNQMALLLWFVWIKRQGDGEADQDGVRGASWRNPEDDNGRRSKTPTSPATFFRQFDSQVPHQASHVPPRKPERTRSEAAPPLCLYSRQMHRAVSAIDDTIQVSVGKLIKVELASFLRKIPGAKVPCVNGP